MKRKICIGVMILLIPALVLADLDVDINIATDGEANVYANPNTIGDTNYYIDGVDFQQTVSSINQRFSGRTFDLTSVLVGLGDVLVNYDYRSKTRKIQDYKRLEPVEIRFRETLDFYISYKLTERDAYYQNILNQMNLEILSLQKLVNSSELCNARLQTAYELNISSVSCGEKRFYNKYGEFVGIKLEE